MVEESDEDEGQNASPIHVESRPPTTTPGVPPTGAAVEANVREDSKSSSASGNDGEGKPSGDAPEKAVVSTSSASSGSSGDSSAYRVSNADLREVAETLDASGAKLIGGQVIGSLRLESRDWEREFLLEAGGSFCFPPDGEETDGHRGGQCPAVRGGPRSEVLCGCPLHPNIVGGRGRDLFAGCRA